MHGIDALSNTGYALTCPNVFGDGCKYCETSAPGEQGAGHAACVHLVRLHNIDLCGCPERKADFLRDIANG